ncbi:hypothetical protein CPB83DRAFT_862956 [Crepidotus variabilis]|uniref:F-box domain-containing protein n=1 Tax=Crepidotus variabilis TaxID=179855 RepID=A0A9P6E6G2_9AGAR|nr:hypothetical protein CPB83DRAFT_862956 [Crepidotus variabilis]
MNTGHSFYPVDNLPPELLMRIFFETISDDYQNIHQTSNKCSPIQLCHVSSQWRAVAQAIPQLWMTLRTHLTILTFISRKGHSLEEIGRFLSPMTQEFLLWWLSHLPPSYPFRLVLDQPRDFRAFYHSDKHTLETIDASNIKTYAYAKLFTAPFFRRVRELEMILPETDLMLMNRSRFSDLQSLESVTISTTGSPGFYYQTTRGVGKFPLASRLSHLSLNYAKLLDCFPAEQLTKLCITEEISPFLFRQVFTERCPNLVYANFTMEGPFANGMYHPSFSTPSIVPNLRYLTLSNGAFSDFSHIQHGLILPSVSALRLHKASTRFGTISQVLMRFLEDYPGLVDLYLDETFFPVPSIFENGTDFSSLRNSLMETHPQLVRVTLDLRQGVRSDRARDYYKRLVLSTWIRPTSGSGGGRLEVLLPSRGSRLPSEYFFEDQLIEEVAAYWKQNRKHLYCDVAFRQASSK